MQWTVAWLDRAMPRIGHKCDCKPSTKRFRSSNVSVHREGVATFSNAQDERPNVISATAERALGAQSGSGKRYYHFHQMTLADFPSDLSDHSAIRAFVDSGSAAKWARLLLAPHFREDVAALNDQDRNGKCDVQDVVMRLEALQHRLAHHRESRWYRYLPGIAWLADVRSEVFVRCLLAICYQYLNQSTAAETYLRMAREVREATRNISRFEVFTMILMSALNPITVFQSLGLEQVPREDPELLRHGALQKPVNDVDGGIESSG